MINTINSKPDHYKHGTYAIGSGPEIVLILGSCRVVPYANYFHYLNADNRFTIHLCNVVNFYYNEKDDRVNPAESTVRYENDEILLDVIKKTKWFIHEHSVSFGMFNTSKDEPKNIFQFGMNPECDISIPNFNDIFILFQELIDFDAGKRERAKQELAQSGELSSAFKENMKTNGLLRIAHFLEICAQTSLPEMVQVFKENWTKTRYWWTGNHISNAFSETVFRLMNDKFLHIPISADAQKQISELDMYSTPRAPITKYDVEAYGLQWPQPIEQLKTS